MGLRISRLLLGRDDLVGAVATRGHHDLCFRCPAPLSDHRSIAMTRYTSAAEIMPWTDRKLLRNDPPPWTDVDLVAAQCMACEGKGIAEIALELGRSQEQVAKLLDQDSGQK